MLSISMPLLIIRLYWLVVKYLDHHFRQLLIDFLRVIMGELAGGEKEKKNNSSQGRTRRRRPPLLDAVFGPLARCVHTRRGTATLNIRL